MKHSSILTLAVCIFCIFFASFARAGSATWNLNPPTNSWFNAANWSPATIPNGTSDVATFGVTNLSAISGMGTTLSAIVFNPGASSYFITVPLGTHTISGPGITNNAGTQNFTIVAGQGEGTFGEISFTNSANAGNSTQFTINGTDNSAFFAGDVAFHDTASAGFGTYFLLPGTHEGGIVYFFDNASAGTGTFFDSGEIDFEGGGATAADGYFEIEGGTTSGGFGGNLALTGGAQGANGQFVINAGTVAGAKGGVMAIVLSASAGAAQIFANDGPGEGGLIDFTGLSATTGGGTASVQLNGKGKMDISGAGLNPTIGSLAGDGQVFLGGRKLTVGRNHVSTTFSGLIQDGGISGGTGGSFAKVGSGTLTVMGANTYTGATSVNGGTLKVINTTGSATGTGSVQVNAGDLGGSGIIAGPITVGANNADRPHLSPATGSQVPGVVTIQSALTFNSNGGYDYLLRASGGRIQADRVSANGVVINSGASFSLLASVRGSVQVGTSVTVISNTSVNPINGTFSNLADGAVLTVGANKFQANYEGGDGNDLVLTVVP
jgi:fibronectin-binding autotransporter adhesin